MTLREIVLGRSRYRIQTLAAMRLFVLKK
ncbi:Protein CBG27929 [Caenorhabditis briggsae]|uniref:Protein CBG27929 n=1 Tax=Caenorhabditis briggsae TaxID=6238 RepID=B6IJM1_CAEBR|nr:Protein CBG27929 [Caenorhabditis briggsae]CAS00101.1 Protein CBG27929 [Caenorhabditis briggsae]